MNYFQFPCRLYSGPKDSAYFTILSSSAYEKIMKYNVDQELSFNSWDISIDKTLKNSKSAIFAHSDVVEHSGCMVGLYLKFYQQF